MFVWSPEIRSCDVRHIVPGRFRFTSPWRRHAMHVRRARIAFRGWQRYSTPRLVSFCSQTSRRMWQRLSRRIAPRLARLSREPRRTTAVLAREICFDPRLACLYERSSHSSCCREYIKSIVFGGLDGVCNPPRSRGFAIILFLDPPTTDCDYFRDRCVRRRSQPHSGGCRYLGLRQARWRRYCECVQLCKRHLDALCPAAALLQWVWETRSPRLPR